MIRAIVCGCSFWRKLVSWAGIHRPQKFEGPFLRVAASLLMISAACWGTTVRSTRPARKRCRRWQPVMRRCTFVALTMAASRTSCGTFSYLEIRRSVSPRRRIKKL